LAAPEAKPDDPTMPRFYCPVALAIGQTLTLPDGAARHVQVLRLQPGDAITLFNAGPIQFAGPGWGGEFDATVTHMGRTEVGVAIGAHRQVEREPQRAVHLAVGMPANDRMDWLVEKATELGVASIRPLMTERSVLRLSGERADKKVAHWQSVAIAACEQCGGNLVPAVHRVLTLTQWFAVMGETSGRRLLLSLRDGSVPLRSVAADTFAAIFLSGPEGGFSAAEESAALDAGFNPVSLGARVLRSETAALAALAVLG
jgi:16S rRNA (uracil1498-N3)-methyltransferase